MIVLGPKDSQIEKLLNCYVYSEMTRLFTFEDIEWKTVYACTAGPKASSCPHSYRFQLLKAAKNVWIWTDVHPHKSTKCVSWVLRCWWETGPSSGSSASLSPFSSMMLLLGSSLFNQTVQCVIDSSHLQPDVTMKPLPGLTGHQRFSVLSPQTQEAVAQESRCLIVSV